MCMCDKTCVPARRPATRETTFASIITCVWRSSTRSSRRRRRSRSAARTSSELRIGSRCKSNPSVLAVSTNGPGVGETNRTSWPRARAARASCSATAWPPATSPPSTRCATFIGAARGRLRRAPSRRRRRRARSGRRRAKAPPSSACRAASLRRAGSRSACAARRRRAAARACDARSAGVVARRGRLRRSGRRASARSPGARTRPRGTGCRARSSFALPAGSRRRRRRRRAAAARRAARTAPARAGARSSRRTRRRRRRRLRTAGRAGPRRRTRRSARRTDRGRTRSPRRPRRRRQPAPQTVPARRCRTRRRTPRRAPLCRRSTAARTRSASGGSRRCRARSRPGRSARDKPSREVCSHRVPPDTATAARSRRGGRAPRHDRVLRLRLELLQRAPARRRTRALGRPRRARRARVRGRRRARRDPARLVCVAARARLRRSRVRVRRLVGGRAADARARRDARRALRRRVRARARAGGRVAGGAVGRGGGSCAQPRRARRRAPRRRALRDRGHGLAVPRARNEPEHGPDAARAGAPARAVGGAHLARCAPVARRRSLSPVRGRARRVWIAWRHRRGVRRRGGDGARRGALAAREGRARRGPHNPRGCVFRHRQAAEPRRGSARDGGDDTRREDARRRRGAGVPAPGRDRLSVPRRVPAAGAADVPRLERPRAGVRASEAQQPRRRGRRRARRGGADRHDADGSPLGREHRRGGDLDVRADASRLRARGGCVKPRLLVLNQYYRPGLEATAVLLAELCRELARDFDVTVVTGKVRGSRTDRRSVDDGVEVVRVPSTSFRRANIWLRALNYATYLLGSLLIALRMPRADIVLCMTDPPVIADVALVAARRFRAPLVVVSQDVFPETAIELRRVTNPLVVGLLRAAIRFYLRRADRIVAIGETMRARLVAKGARPERVSVISNWVDTNALVPQPRRNAWSAEQALDDRFVVMHSGNVGHAQDLDTLVRAAPLLRDLDDLAIAIVGDGARRDELVALAHELGVDRVVTFLPYQPREVLPLSLSSAAVHVLGLARGLAGYVVPSRVYGVLAVARPVIAAADAESETAQLVEAAGCGVVVAPGEPVRLAEAIRAAHDGVYDLDALGAAGREWVVANADRSIAVGRYRELLHAILR